MAIVDIFLDRNESVAVIDRTAVKDAQSQLDDYFRFFNSFFCLVRDDFYLKFADFCVEELSFSEYTIKHVSQTISREIGRGDVFRPKHGYHNGYLNGFREWMTSPGRMNERQVDQFLKERLSFVEVFFRMTENYAKNCLSENPNSDSYKDFMESVKKWISEANERLRKRNIPFQYRDGILYPSSDHLISKKIEEPFWKTIADPKWNQTMQHMKEAVDQQVANPSVAAFEAQQALESVLSEFFRRKGGGIPAKTSNLHNNRIISQHEKEMIDKFFSKIRHPSTHPMKASAPGKPVKRSHKEAIWIIGFSMYTIKRIIDGSNS